MSWVVDKEEGGREEEKMGKGDGTLRWKRSFLFETRLARARVIS